MPAGNGIVHSDFTFDRFWTFNSTGLCGQKRRIIKSWADEPQERVEIAIVCRVRQLKKGEAGAKVADNVTFRTPFASLLFDSILESYNTYLQCRQDT